MNRYILIVLAILVLGSAGFGISQLNEVQKLKQNAAEADRERAALKQRIADLQKQNNDLEKRPSARQDSSRIPLVVGEQVSDDGRQPDNGGSPLPRFRDRNDGGYFGAAMSSPEAQKLMAVQRKAGLDSRYSGLFKQLQLAPADLEKFKTLLVDKQAAVMDVMAAARAEGLNGRENRDQIRQLVQTTQSELDNNIRATLGDAGYAQYQSFETTQPQRNVVSQLEQRLSYSPAPLTDAQSQQLVQILADTTSASGGRNGLAATPASVATRGGTGISPGGAVQITTDAITRAQGVLSAQQLSALQDLQQEQQASIQLRQQMRDSFQARAQGGTTPAFNSTATPPRS